MVIFGSAYRLVLHTTHWFGRSHLRLDEFVWTRTGSAFTVPLPTYIPPTAYTFTLHRFGSRFRMPHVPRCARTPGVPQFWFFTPTHLPPATVPFFAIHVGFVYALPFLPPHLPLRLPVWLTYTLRSSTLPSRRFLYTYTVWTHAFTFGWFYTCHTTTVHTHLQRTGSPLPACYLPGYGLPDPPPTTTAFYLHLPAHGFWTGWTVLLRYLYTTACSSAVLPTTVWLTYRAGSATFATVPAVYTACHLDGCTGYARTGCVRVTHMPTHGYRLATLVLYCYYTHTFYLHTGRRLLPPAHGYLVTAVIHHHPSRLFWTWLHMRFVTRRTDGGSLRRVTFVPTVLQTWTFPRTVTPVVILRLRCALLPTFHYRQFYTFTTPRLPLPYPLPSGWLVLDSTLHLITCPGCVYHRGYTVLYHAPRPPAIYPTTAVGYWLDGVHYQLHSGRLLPHIYLRTVCYQFTHLTHPTLPFCHVTSVGRLLYVVTPVTMPFFGCRITPVRTHTPAPLPHLDATARSGSLVGSRSGSDSGSSCGFPDSSTTTGGRSTYAIPPACLYATAHVHRPGWTFVPLPALHTYTHLFAGYLQRLPADTFLPLHHTLPRTMQFTAFLRTGSVHLLDFPTTPRLPAAPCRTTPHTTFGCSTTCGSFPHLLRVLYTWFGRTLPYWPTPGRLHTHAAVLPLHARSPTRTVAVTRFAIPSVCRLYHAFGLPFYCLPLSLTRLDGFGEDDHAPHILPRWTTFTPLVSSPPGLAVTGYCLPTPSVYRAVTPHADSYCCRTRYARSYYAYRFTCCLPPLRYTHYRTHCYRLPTAVAVLRLRSCYG